MAGPEIREDDNFARPLLKAVESGDWNATRDFLNEHPRALTARMTTFMGGTVLHAAVDAEQQEIVMELVNMMSEHDLAMKDNFGYTALHISGNQKMAECLIRKNKELVSIRNKGKLLPVALAMSDGHKELARYLYSQTPFQDLEADRDFNGASLLNSCFYQGDLGMVIKNTAIDSIRGAALQMQREVQWFKEVERICPLTHKEISNKYKLTARQLFTKDHNEMRKEGENWMKGTATSCTVVGALITTIVVAAAFTISGGNNQDTGLPILHDELFKLFIVTNSLSLCSSSMSVLTFLGILTSRYAEEDFLRSLPRKMIIGLSALLFSIATMIIAFSTALLLMLRGKYKIVIPIIGLASVPIILFVLMQFRILIDMLVSTYGSGIFDEKMKPWL
ncbi:ankyrin repeat-containing protein ITN1-like [Juglans regia]|uniref:Ankyrin repeat-containing protein ITN1-like n=1 Tax=Juglans regia TaxID=51240 RepID=A0A6P9E4P9_JUGRE|nr:ankyrin repeat-containing protein ITN1-like [Juglans regia]